MAIPARHIIGILAKHLLAARDNILENFIERMADVNIAIGIGGAIMQHKFRPPLGLGPHLPIEVNLLPMR